MLIGYRFLSSFFVSSLKEGQTKKKKHFIIFCYINKDKGIRKSVCTSSMHFRFYTFISLLLHLIKDLNTNNLIFYCGSKTNKKTGRTKFVEAFYCNHTSIIALKKSLYTRKKIIETIKLKDLFVFTRVLNRFL